MALHTIPRSFLCPSDQTRVLFLLPNLAGGGAQRVALTLLRHLDRDQFQPLLALVDKSGELVSEVPSDVPIIDLAAGRARFALPKIIQTIRTTRPDIVLSFQGYLNLMTALARPFIPRTTRLLCRETNLPSLHNTNLPFPWLIKILYKSLYRTFDTVICQSQDMREDLIRYAGLDRKRATVIPNPVDVEHIDQLAHDGTPVFSPGKKHILAAGKLLPQKGFDLLLQAMALIPDETIHLTILGQGPLDEELKNLARDLGVDQRVVFAGFQPNPYPFMAQADLFVLSSRYEGFPNVLLEALACGTPAVAFDCSGGIREIVQEGVNGFMAQPRDASDLAGKVARALKTSWNHQHIRDSIAHRYESRNITGQYEKLFTTNSG